MKFKFFFTEILGMFSEIIYGLIIICAGLLISFLVCH